MSTSAPTQGNRLVVGIADLKLSRKPGEFLVTYALGSCLGISIYDPRVRVGGILHAMLPSASTEKDRPDFNPAKFVDSGVTTLFREAYKMGAAKERIVVKVAGGASVANSGGQDSFQIGKRNIIAMKKLFWKNGVLLKGEDLGGHISRTMTLDLASGEVRIKSNGRETIL